MSIHRKLQYKQNTKPAFTLIELLVTVSIISILMALAYPNIQNSLVRSNVCKVAIDMNTISKALSQYYVDYMDYPSASKSLSQTLEIDKVHALTTPYAYLTRIPQFPWKGKKGIFFNTDSSEKFEYYPQSNYIFSKKNDYDPDSGNASNQNGWYIISGGPVSITMSSSSKDWYTPTNGLLSWGCFYMDSNGKTNCR